MNISRSICRGLPFVALLSAFSSFRIGGAEIALNGQRFTLPDGFEVKLVAGTNLVSRPVSASFDAKGFLYVTDSSGSNEAPQKQVQNPTHRILRLEDTDGDGTFDKQVVFAEKVMFPQGCLWHDGSVYVAAPPSIWKFTDTDGDGVADKREEWFKGGTLTGCANDIHGPYLGPEGYIYWTKGAFAEQTHERPGKKAVHDRAAHIFRARPDGSDLDVIMTGGMDNPVEVAFTAEGETIFSSTFIDFTQPGFRDGVAHAVYGGVFGKANNVLEDGLVKRPGPDLLHPFYEAGAAAECGLCRYQGRQFGADYQDNLFATTFNLHKVTRHKLRLNGASYASTDSDFLASDSLDFHPTDVMEDADGSLLVVDTGGWYKLCCPSSQLAKPDVLGAIYRVRKADAKRPANRTESYRALVQPPAISAESRIAALRKAVWKNDPSNAALFKKQLADNGSRTSTDPEAAHLVRLASEGLARLKIRDAAPPILEAIAAGPTSDPFFQDSLIYSLIEIANAAQTRPGLSHPSAAEQRAALIALDQMDAGDLKASEVFPLLKSSDEKLRAAAVWVFGRHPEWAAAGSEFASELLSSQHSLTDENNRLLQTLAVAPQVQSTIAKNFGGAASSQKAALFKCVAESRASEFSPEWIEAIRSGLSDGNPEEVARAAIAAARSVNRDPKKPGAQALALKPILLSLAEDASKGLDLRLQALLAAAGPVELTDTLLASSLKALDPSGPPAIRAEALQVLQRAKLSAAQLDKIIETVPTVGPLELPRLIGVFEQHPDDALGKKLLAALAKSKAAQSLPAGTLKTVFGKYPSSIQPELSALLASIDAEAAGQAARMDSLAAELHSIKGDVRRGQLVFNSARAACSACHRMGYLGGDVGPDLTSIGQARSERDLLEAVVFPSASFVRSYEPVVVSTKGGESYSGVLRKDAPDELVLATGPNAEVKLARSEVAEMRPGTVSVMPQGLDQQLSRQELADLVAFLKNTTWGPR